MLYIGLDDTDNLQSRGTGRLAREIGTHLAPGFGLLGVVRHQLLKDPRVPFTKNNSSATILLHGNEQIDLQTLADQVEACMRADYQVGSDPGLCVAAAVPFAVLEFGLRAKRELVTQEEARDLARVHGLVLRGLGGTEGGVIGALAAVGLSAGGEDGRYVLVGASREISGLLPVSAVLQAGVEDVRTLDGSPVREGLIVSDKLRPARRDGRPILFVEAQDGHWAPVKLD